MVFVDDRRAFAELAKVADDRLGFAPAALAPLGLVGTLWEQLALGKHHDLRRVHGETVFQRRNGDGEPGQSRSRPREKIARKAGSIQPFSRLREKVARRAG